MLTHRWFCFALSLLLIGTIFAQDDDDGGKFRRRPPMAGDDDDDDNDRQNEPADKAKAAPPTAPPTRAPQNAPPKVEPRRSPPPTPLASSNECKDDVQKYCNKGVTKPLPNLKVLQCVDDLDNVR